MKFQQSQQPSQRMALRQRWVLIAGIGIAVTLIAAIMVISQIFKSNDSTAASNGNVRYTISAGAWGTSSNWHNGQLPQAGDSVRVLHNMTNIQNYTLGSNNLGALVVGSGVTFNPSSFTFGNNGRFYNYGTTTWSNNPQWNGSPIWFLNYGTMTFPQSMQPNGTVNIYNYSGATLRCSSSVLLPNSSLLYNEGTVDMRGDFTARQNTNITNVAGTMNIGTSSGQIILEGVTNFNNAAGATLNLLRGLTTQNQMTTFNNAGTMNFGSVSQDVSTTFNLVTLNNTSTGTLNHYGNIKLNSGNNNPVNSITNNNNFNVYGSIETHGPSIVTTSDTFYVENTANFGSEMNVTGSTARLLVDGDLILNNKTGAALNMINGGGILVDGNLTVPTGKSITGTGTGNKLTVGGTTTNNGTLGGNFDICDLSGVGDPDYVDNNNGTIQSGVTNCVGNPLPVQFVSVSAVANNAGGATISWRTASELNNSHFVVERSTDGRNFRKVGQVKGNGTKMTATDYSFNDNTPVDGMVYYRLHQFDYNGDNDYSKVVTIRKGDATGKDAIAITLYPNPVSLSSHSSLNVRYVLNAADQVRTELVSATGAMIQNRTSRLPAGQTIESFPLSSLKPGVYSLRVIPTSGGRPVSQQFIVNP